MFNVINTLKDTIIDSFLNNEMTAEERNHFYKVFSLLADKLVQLPIKEVNVIVSRVDDSIVFEITLENETFLRVQKPVGSEDEDMIIYYTSEKSGQLHIDDLIEKFSK